MLKKILSIQGIGRYERFGCSGDVEFKNYTLIYADNGVGKTTLCDIIRSMQTGNPAPIFGRRTLGSSLEPEAKILLSDNRVAHFKNGQWSLTLSGVTIFDATYIRDNVHAGEIVDLDHRRNLFQVVVGEEGVLLARVVENLETQKLELNAPIRTSKATVESSVPKGMTLVQFLNLEPDPIIDERIENTARALVSAQQSVEMKSYRGFQEVPTPSLPVSMSGILALTLDDVSEVAERRLREHLTTLHSSGAQRWLSYGLTLIHDESCPFCAKNLQGNDLVQAYRANFSASYRDLAQQSSDLQRAIEEGLNDVLLARLESIVTQNGEAARYWATFCMVPPLPTLNLTHISEAVATIRTKALILAERKIANLLEPISEDAATQVAREQLIAVDAELSAYNVAVKIANAAVEAHKAAIDSLDIGLVTASLSKLHAQKARFLNPTKTACDTYQQLQSQRLELDARKTEARNHLEQYMSHVITNYEGALNQHLERFAVGFRIRGTKAEFPRGLPSSSYQLMINNVPVDLGNEKTEDHEPSFKNTLSGGDRSALALSLFLAQLERSTTVPEIAVLLDDPFQSQDSFRRSATAFRIRDIGRRCGQVIVMSHDPHFLKLVWDNLPTDQRKALQLHSAGSSTALTAWDIQEAVKESHLRDMEALQRYIEGHGGNADDIVRKIRPTLEGYCRAVCPGQFGNKALGEILEQIRSDGPSHILHNLLGEVEEINFYARQFHHAPGEIAPDVVLNAGELQSYCRRALKAIRTRGVV